ncbi:MAG: hypothetical protein CMK59_07920 [Proteobacteria bacterium]|nr:hypothetical protein [Pseudomonadota bacterium]
MFFRGVIGVFLSGPLCFLGCVPKDKVGLGSSLEDSGVGALCVLEELNEDTGYVDFDGDGFISEEDCDDTDPMINPASIERCNGIDDDCDGVIDNNEDGAWFYDLDEDGYGSDLAEEDCSGTEQVVSRGGDCDDSNAGVYPGSSNLLDGVDSDCNGQKDWLATIYVAVDDAGELCVNGTSVGETGNWMDGRVYEVWIESGAATIGIHGWDVGFHVTAAIAHIELSDGTIWVSDETWRYDPEPLELSGKQGWCHNGFDDSSWEYVLDLGPIGNPQNPWGYAPSIFPANSPAHWIWDHFPVNLNTQYLRKQLAVP